MLYKNEKPNNQKFATIRQYINKVNILFEPKITPKVFNHKYSSRNFRKTNYNFNSNLTLTPFSVRYKNKLREDENKENKIYYLNNIIKAPSMVHNNTRLHKFIRMKKSQRLQNINSIYSRTLISEAQTYRNNLYLTSTDLEPIKKINLTRNKSCNNFQIKNSKQKYKTINKTNSDKKHFNYNKTTQDFNLKIPDTNNNLPQSILKNENILLALENANAEKETNNAFNSLLKIKMELINSLNIGKNKPTRLDDIEKKLIKFRIIQDIQDKNVQSKKIKNDFIKDIYINKLIKLKQIFQIKNENYKKNIKSYLFFLRSKLRNYREEVHMQNIEIFQIYSDMEKIMIKLIKIQSELEKLVEIRNFILKAKDEFDKTEQPKIYYDLLLIKDSKILLIENILNSINFIKEFQNKPVKQFIKHLQNVKNNILNIDNDLELNQDILDSLDFPNVQLKEIFESKESLSKLFEYLTDKNINLLCEYQHITRENNNLKIKYEKNKNSNKNYYIIEEIKELKEKQLQRDNLIKKNKILSQRCAYYIMHIDEKINHNYISKKHKNNSVKSFLNYKLNLDTINKEKYQNELKNYKYKGLMLLEKLINYIKSFLNSNYAKKDFYENFKNRSKLYVLDINIKLFKEDDKTTINSNILKAISIYEQICKYTMLTYEKLKENKKNLQFIRKQENILKKNKKINNLIKERIAKKEKDNENKKKIFEKAVKPILYLQTKFDVENKIMKNKIKNARKKEREKHQDEIEFNEMAKFISNNYL